MERNFSLKPGNCHKPNPNDDKSTTTMDRQLSLKTINCQEQDLNDETPETKIIEVESGSKDYDLLVTTRNSETKVKSKTNSKEGSKTHCDLTPPTKISERSEEIKTYLNSKIKIYKATTDVRASDIKTDSNEGSNKYCDPKTTTTMITQASVTDSETGHRNKISSKHLNNVLETITTVQKDRGNDSSSKQFKKVKLTDDVIEGLTSAAQQEFYLQTKSKDAEVEINVEETNEEETNDEETNEEETNEEETNVEETNVEETNEEETNDEETNDEETNEEESNVEETNVEETNEEETNVEETNGKETNGEETNGKETNEEETSSTKGIKKEKSLTKSFN